MSVADFQAVVAALEAGSAPVRPDTPTIGSLAVLGADPTGRALAAAGLAAGLSVRLWSPSARVLEELTAGGAITVRGDDLVGSYATDPDSPAHLDLVASVDQATDGADVVFVTGTVAEQRAAAKAAARCAAPGQILVAVPGLTFGALELRWWLRTAPHQPACTLVELHPEPWTITSTGPASIHLRRRAPARLATMPAAAGPGIAEALAAFLPAMELHPTVIHTSLTDTTAIAEVPALMLGGPALAPDPETLLPGAVPIDDNPSATALTPRLASVIGALAMERRRVAGKWGVRDIPPDPTWLAEVYSEAGPAPTDAVGTTARARVLNLAAGSLVPLASAAEAVGVEVPVTTALLDVITAMFGFDVWAAGRRLEALGLGGTDLDRIRRATSTGGEG